MNHTIRRLLAGLAAVMTVGTIAPIGAQESADAKFLMDAIRDNMAEVKIGDYAENHAGSDVARDFGKMLGADHGKALKTHAALARSKKIAVPTEVTAEQGHTYDKLAKLSGAEFDRAFAQAMVAGHQKAIAAYEKEATSGRDPDIVALASDTLPTLREHLAHAQALAEGGIRTSQRPDSNAPSRLE